MDIWTLFSIILLVSVALFLVAVAVVSAMRMPRDVLWGLYAAGVMALLIVLADVWVRNQPWIHEAVKSVIEFISSFAGFIVAYALIAFLTRLVYREQPRNRLHPRAHV